MSRRPVEITVDNKLTTMRRVYMIVNPKGVCSTSSRAYRKFASRIYSKLRKYPDYKFSMRDIEKIFSDKRWSANPKITKVVYVPPKPVYRGKPLIVNEILKQGKVFLLWSPTCTEG